MSAAYTIIDFAFVLSQCKIFTLRYTLDTYAKIIFITLQDINFTAIMCIENIAAGTADYSIIFSTELNNTVLPASAMLPVAVIVFLIESVGIAATLTFTLLSVVPLLPA